MAVCQGCSTPTIDSFVILNAAELLSATLKEMSPYNRAVLEAHFFDGESIFKIQRRYNLKRRDLEAMIEAALVTMRSALRSRGVRAVADVI